METMPDPINQELNTDTSESEARLARKKAEWEESLKKKGKGNNKETSSESQTPEPELSEKDFTPEDWGKVNELAFFIYEHRMLDANDPATIKEQEKWAKDYGLPEDIFTKKSIREIISSAKVNGENINEWTPEAKHFMHDWDLKMAIDVYSRKKKDWEQKKKTLSEENEKKIGEVFGDARGTQMKDETEKNEPEETETAPAASEKKKFQGLSKGRNIVPEGSRGSKTETAPKFVEKRKEKTELDILREKEARCAKAYADLAGKADASQGFLSRMLKRRKGDVSDDVLELLEKWEASKKKLEAALLDDVNEKYKNGALTEAESKKRMADITFSSAQRRLNVLAERDKNRLSYGTEKGWLSPKVATGWEKFEKVWKKIPLPLKIGLGVGFGFVGGWTALAGFGVMRTIGGIMSGKGVQEMLQKAAGKSRLRDIERNQAGFVKDVEQRNLSVEEMHNLARKTLDKRNDNLKNKIISEGKWDRFRKWAGWATGLVVGTGIVANAVGRLGIGRSVMEQLGLADTPPPTGPGTAGEIAKESHKGIISHIAQQNESPLGILRRSLMENTNVVGADGMINLNDPAANDYFHYLQDHGKLPKNLINIQDVSQMSAQEKIQFLKVFENRMNGYYSGLRQTIENNMAANPKYYNSLNIEMKNLADNLDQYSSFNDLPPELKRVVIGDRLAANMYLDKHGSLSGAASLKVGDTVNIFQNPEGRFDFDVISGHEDVAKESAKAARKAGEAAVGKSGVGAGEAFSNAAQADGAANAENFEDLQNKKIEAARARGAAAEVRRQETLARLRGESQIFNEQAIAGATKANAQLWNMWLKDGVGNGFQMQSRAADVWQGIKNLSGEITSDQPLAATVDNILTKEKAVGFTQELFNQFPVSGNETMGQYIQRLSSSDFNLFNKIKNNYHL